MESSPQGPFPKFWSVVSIALSVLGLTSISDSVVAWHRFLKDIVDHFNAFITSAFGTLPFAVPYYVQIYIVFGLAYIAACQAVPDDYEMSSGRRIRAIVVATPIMLMFWPLSFIALLSGRYEQYPLEHVKRRTILRNLCLSIGVLIILVFLFSDITGRLRLDLPGSQ